MIPRSLKIYTDTGLGDSNPSFKGLDIISYSFQPVRMGTPKLTATLMYDTCLDDEWTGEEYVVLGGERYYIRDTPTSSKDNTDARYRHELVFTSERTEKLGDVYFYDTVYSQAFTKDKPRSNSTTFSFYGTIDEFVDRLNCAFKYAGIGDSILDTKTHLTTNDTPVGDGYCAMYNPYLGDALSVTKPLSFEDTYLIDAINQGYEAYEIPFEYKGRAVIFGAESEVVEHTFEYGHDNELLSVSKKNANAKVINRITMVGSSENIPYYYPNETEYGNISIVVGDNNETITKASVKVVNRTQMLSRMEPDEYATLVKFEGNETDAAASVLSYQSAVDGDEMTDYILGSVVDIETSSSHNYNAYWNLAVKFRVAVAADFVLSEVKGQVWKTNQPEPTDIGNIMNVRFVSLEKNNQAVDNEVRKDESGIYLGHLMAGDYTLRFDIPVNTRDAGRGYGLAAKCRLSGVTLGVDASNVKKGFYWNYKGRDYKMGEFGVDIVGGVTDAMIGDKFGWTVVSRMPFQQNLMPSKYFDTNGDERFYNAVNGLYIDPDTNQPYTFPNPYTDGTRSEYIHRNEDIKPTIEGVVNSGGHFMGSIAGIAYDMNDNDSLAAESTDEDKNDASKYEHSYFYIKLNIFDGEYGFNLFQHASQTDPMTIQMTSGNCNGCKFKIQAVEFTEETGLVSFKNPVRTNSSNGSIVAGDYADKVKKDGFQEWQQDTSANSIWICVQKDADTFGVIIPNKSNGYLPAVGDTFNIINIDLPDVYIRAAEKRLEQDGLRFMADNNEGKFTFDISASRIFFAENPDVLESLDEYSKLKVKYNGKNYELYVSSLNIKVNGADALPDIQINLTDTISVGQNFVSKVAERAASLIANAMTTGGDLGTGGGGMSAVLADKRYLNKQKADRTPYKVGSDVGFEIGEFVSGSSGGLFYIDPDTGQSYIEVDRMKVRMKAVFEELQSAIVDSIGGKLIITPGGSIQISYVEERADAYRCYFKAKESDKGAECRFHVNDQVQCHSLNIQSGTQQNASNAYYWRLVTAVNNNESYVDLSKTDYDSTSTDIPHAGDTLCQLGARTDAKRQSAIVLSTSDEFAPCVTLYSGIDGYSLVNKAVVEYGVDKTKTPPRPFFHCYGESYVGPRDESTFVKYTPEAGVEIKGKLSVESTVGDKTLENYIKEVAPPVEQEDIETFVNNIVNPKLEDIQNQIDGVIETWFSKGVPTLTNYPASEWNTDNLKIAHLGDLYYDNDTGTAYRFSKDESGAYYWNVITDAAITKALAAAKEAKDLADGKRRVFTAQPTAQQEYDEGDLWVNATYGTQYSNDILRCVTHKGAGAPFDADHWTLASKYTDDSALNQFIVGYQDEIADIKTQLDGKAETWYQSTDPSTVARPNGWLGESANMHKGDLWYKTTDDTTWFWSGTAWEKQAVPQSVFDAIDGKADIFVSKPTGGYRVNDLWFLEDSYTLSDGTHPKGTLAVATANMGIAWSYQDWAKKDRYTDDTLAQSALDRFAAWSADGVFSPTEMKDLELERERIDGDKTNFDSRYGIFGSSTIPDLNLDNAKSAYDAAYTAYRADITSVLTATPDADGCVAIPADFKTKMQHYYNVRAQYDYILSIALKKYSEVLVKQYDYLKDAIGDVSTTIGGVFLTSIIRLGQHNKDLTTQTVWSGLNGVHEKSNNRDISYWAGGDMLDLFNDDDTRATLAAGARPAASVIRMDGSAYFAKGNIGFKADGSGWLGNDLTGIKFTSNGQMTFGSGVTFNVSNVSGLQTTLNTLGNFNTALSSLLTPCNAAGQEISWSEATLADTENGGIKAKSIKAKVGLWSTGFLSALGLNTGGTGGGGGGVTQLRMLTDVGIKDSTLSSGQSLVYDGTKWVNQKISMPSLDGYATESWVTGKGYITSSALTPYLTKNDASSTYVAKEAGKGLSTNDFTTALLNKLNGIESGANKYVLPVASASVLGGVKIGTRLSIDANGVLSATYTYTLPTASASVKGGVKVGGGLTIANEVLSVNLSASHIPALPISKITGLQTSLDSKLNKSVFDELFEKVNIGSSSSPVWTIRAKYGLYSDGFLSAMGVNGASGGGTSFGLMKTWPTSDPTSGTTEALGANLGWELRQDTLDNASDIASLDTRVTSLEGGSALSVSTTGAGNAVTSVTKSGTAITVTKGTNFLTSHQTIRTLTIQKNGSAVGTFNPTASANSTINITDVASASTLSSHTGNTTVHITSAERTKWNKVVTDFAAITGADSDSVINKWEEVVAFLDTYTEADTLAGLLSNKADKTTSINAGTGLTGGGTLAASRTLSLAASGVTAGTYTKVTVDTYGRVTAGATLAVADIPSLPWSKITSGKPTTLSGYGITDAYTKTEADGRYVNLTGAQTISGAKTFSSILTIAPTNISGIQDGLVLHDNGGGNSEALRIKWTSSSFTTGVTLTGQPWLSRIESNANFVAPRFIKSGGTSSQFLKADGSVDGTAYLPKATFDALFEKVNIGTASAPVYAIKAKFGLYTEQFLSARGVNPNGGSGGGGGLIQKVYGSSSLGGSFSDSTLTDTFNAYTINKIRTDLAARISSLEGGSALSVATTGNGNAITAISKSGTAITATKGTMFLTSHQSLANYVTLNSAQTISGAKTFSSAVVQSQNTSGTWWRNNAVMGKFIATNGGTASGWSPVLGFKTVTGKYEIGSMNDSMYINYYHDARTENGVDFQLGIPKNSGTLATQEWVNGRGFLTSHQSVSNKAATLAWATAVTVATIGSTNITVKLPANPNTDTKNTAGSTDTSSKIFLIGATSQAASPQTYSQDTAYVGTDGCLYSGGAKVLTSHQSLANYVTLNTAQTISGAKTFGNITVNGTSHLNGNVYQKNNNFYQRNTKGVYLGVDNDGNFSVNFHENGTYVRQGFAISYSNANIVFYGTVQSKVGVWSDGYVSARGQNTSDARLKTDICDFRATDIIRSLRPKSFRWNAVARHRFKVLDTDAVQYGLIAQETELTNPWLVDRDMFGDGYMGIRYEKLIPVLLKGALEIIDTTNDHERRIENLERENSRLRAENAEFRKRIGELELNFI